MRIGLFGGSFDPIHNGHLMVASMAKSRFKLDAVIFVPCYESAYNKKFMFSADLRSLMVNEVVSKIDGFSYDDYEIRKKDVSYTIDTIKHLQETYTNNEWYLIIGPDGIFTFDTWKDSNEIRNLCKVVFAQYDFYCPNVNIRSTKIRELIRTGLPLNGLVPNEIIYLIEKSYNKGN